MRQKTLRPKFVESAPTQLEDGVLYISDRFRTALHKCCCGCGKEVVTPLNPAGWSYKMEGDSVTLKPSVGNWSFPCKSHYLIIRNEVVCAGAMTSRQIAAIQARDRRDQLAHIAQRNKEKLPELPVAQVPAKSTSSWLTRLIDALYKWFAS